MNNWLPRGGENGVKGIVSPSACGIEEMRRRDEEMRRRDGEKR